MLRLALPIAFQNLLTTSLSLVDTLMIGQLGDVSIAAVGIASQVAFFVNIAMFGIASGGAVFIAQYWGRGDRDGISRAYGIDVYKRQTESSVRKVWIPKTLALVLREWQSKQSALKEFMGEDYIDYNLVLAQETGRPCEDRIIGNAFERLKKKAELPNVVFHSLRHSSTTYKLKLNHEMCIRDRCNRMKRGIAMEYP